MDIYLLALAYLLVAVLLLAIGIRKDTFPDHRDCLDYITIGLLLILWPLTLCLLIWTIHFKKD